MEENTLVKIRRSAYIEDSYDVAMIRLVQYNHVIGQPLMVRYMGRDSRVNTLVALGIGNGPGKDNFKIISNGEIVQANKIYTDRIEDVSQLIHGEVVIGKFSGVYYYCMCLDGVMKQLYPIVHDTVFYNGADGFHWYYSAKTGILKREDDFLTAGVVQSNIDKIMSIITSIVPPTDDPGDTPVEDPGEGGETVVTGNTFAKCSLSVSPTSLLYTGEPRDIVVSYSFTFGGNNITPKALSILLNGEVVNNKPASKNQITVKINTRGKSIIALRATLVLGENLPDQDLYQEIEVMMYPPILTQQSPSETPWLQKRAWDENSVFEFPGEIEVSGTSPGYLWVGIPSELIGKWEERALISSIQIPIVSSGLIEETLYKYFRTEKQQVPGTYKLRLE